MSKEAMKLKTAAEKVVELCGERPLSLGKWFIDMSEACESLREALAEQPAQRPSRSDIKPLTQDLDAPLTLNGVALYPQRTWVGLTDEEIDALHMEVKVRLMGTFDTKDIYRAIEQRLKEKNI